MHRKQNSQDDGHIGRIALSFATVTGNTQLLVLLLGHDSCCRGKGVNVLKAGDVLFEYEERLKNDWPL
jgi:hypothetical protein